ncbi:MAG: hypothetical protein ACE5GM_10030 [bacterium]
MLRKSYYLAVLLVLFSVSSAQGGKPVAGRTGINHDKAPEKIFDIRPPKELPKDYRPWYYLVGAFLAIAALISVIYLLAKRFKKPETVTAPPPPPPLPPEVEAGSALKKLKKQAKEELVDKKGFYSELSEVIRRYLGRRYDFESLEETTDELLYNLNRADLNLEIKTLIEELVFTSDLVKFARHRPRQEDLIKEVETAYEIVEKTTPVKEIQTAGQSREVQ